MRAVFPQIEDFLTRADHTVEWRSDAPYLLDVEQFEAQLAAAQAALRAEQSAAARLHLDQAVQRYRGELLPDCYDDWLFPIRERLRQRYLETIEKLVSLLEEEGDYAAAIRYGELLVRQDALLEKSYRQLMQLHMLNGDHASALRVYHVCTSMLERELGVEPHAETTDLYRRLLRVDGRQPPLAPVEHSPKGGQLVGRQAERKRLLEAWRRAVRGRALFAVVSGEAGIGKTRLAQELFIWVSQLGMDAAHARAYPASTGLAYAPLIEEDDVA